MARKKVNLAWITNDSARRATFKKRRKGLMKKVSELTTLCGVKACVVVYGAGDQQPEVWPSSPEAMRLVARFKSLPEMEQCKKMMNQEGFLRHNISKLQEQLRKHERENREMEVNLLMYECLAGRRRGGLRSVVAIEEATSLAWALDMKLKSVQEKMDSMIPQKDSASGPQPPDFNATLQAQLHNPFPLHPPPVAATSSSESPNLLDVAKNSMQVASSDPALIQRHNYFVGYGAGNKSSRGGMNDVVSGDQVLIQRNMMFGSTSGHDSRLQQDQTLTPGFVENQAMNVNPWFHDHLCSFRPSYRPSYDP